MIKIVQKYNKNRGAVITALFYYFLNIYANVQLVKRDIVTAVIYCYITNEFYYAKRDSRCLSAYIC